jgi:hypothetical protein
MIKTGAFCNEVFTRGYTLMNMEYNKEKVAKVRVATTRLQRNVDILLQSIISARKGVLEPQTISPKSIMDYLIRTMSSFPKDTSPPFLLSKNLINLIYEVCDIHVYISKGILGFVITLTLINRGTFKAYRIILIQVTVILHILVLVNQIYV